MWGGMAWSCAQPLQVETLYTETDAYNPTEGDLIACTRVLIPLEDNKRNGKKKKKKRG